MTPILSREEYAELSREREAAGYPAGSYPRYLARIDAAAPDHRFAGWATAQARADASRGGPLHALVSSRVEGRETGVVWAHNEHPGPLDGQPKRDWWYAAEYSDGSRQEWGPMASGG